jgi:hypothetical protein
LRYDATSAVIEKIHDKASLSSSGTRTMPHRPLPPNPTNGVELGLADEWRQWLCEALIAGATPQSMLESLAAENVPLDIARREIDVLARALPVIAPLHQRMQLVLKLLAVQAPQYISRRPLCSVEEFYDRYFSAFRPVLFSDGCERMAARKWTFDTLKTRFGSIEIEVGDRHPTKMRFDEALEAMSQPAASPELYIVSKNQVLRGPLAEMARDLSPLPDFLHPEHAAPTANLWLGPARTLSPLHHDTTNVYFCHIARCVSGCIIVGECNSRRSGEKVVGTFVGGRGSPISAHGLLCAGG